MSGWFAQPPRAGCSQAFVCLPPAGGAARLYATWGRRMPPVVDVVAVELPGHGRRLLETPRQDLSALATEVADAVADAVSVPFVLFGASFGALLAAETTRALASRGVEPEVLCVASMPAPGRGPAVPHPDELDDEAVRAAAVQGAEGASAEERGELADVAVAAMRADLTMTATYEQGAPLDAPLACFWGRDDPMLDEASAETWRLHTTGPFRAVAVAGGHDFPFRSSAFLAELLRVVGEVRGDSRA